MSPRLHVSEINKMMKPRPGLLSIFSTDGIRTRPNAGSGHWLCFLLPCSIIIYSFHHYVEATPLYKDVLLLSIGMLFSSVFLMCIYAKQKYIHFLIINLVTGLFIGILYVICLHRGILFSSYSGLFSTIGCHTLFLFILQIFPYSFTLGEASIASQALALFLYSTAVNVYNTSHNVPSKVSHISTIIIQIALTGIGITCLLTYLIKALRKPLAFYCTCGLTLIWTVIIPLHIILKRSPVLWILNWMADDVALLKMVTYWLICCFFAVFFLNKQISIGKKASTIDRKAFHLLVVAVYIPGLLYKCSFLYLSSGVVLGIFFLLELLRKLNMPPFGNGLQDAYTIYCDEKDSGAVAVTPIYLLIGCSLPLWIHPAPCDITDSAGFNLLQLLSGVLSIGIGDTMAAVVGSTFGKHRWPDSNRTIEGTLACILSQVIVIFGLVHFGKFKQQLLKGTKFIITVNQVNHKQSHRQCRKKSRYLAMKQRAHDDRCLYGTPVLDTKSSVSFKNSQFLWL